MTEGGRKAVTCKRDHVHTVARTMGFIGVIPHAVGVVEILMTGMDTNAVETGIYRCVVRAAKSVVMPADPAL